MPLIILLAFVLRLINIDKPEGLWNDEYVSWFVASTPFIKGFWQEVLKQCHMPLYYLYLKPFAGCSDLVLRLTSVIPSVLSVYVMYLVGKEFSKKTAVYAGLVTAVLSFLVYYGQEVRFYSLLFLFSALLLLFTMKLLNGKKGWIGYIISSLLILFTHVLGGIYVFFNTVYVLYKKKNLPKFVVVFPVLLLLLPVGIHIFRMLPSSQWWGEFSYTNILFLFSDFFSPILTNNVNAPPEFFYKKDLLWLLLMTVPTLIGFCGLLRGAKKQRGLFGVCLAVILVMAILAVSGKLVFITKYAIEILPVFILLFVLGINDKLFVLFITFHLFAIFTPYYVTNMPRTEGHKIVCDILNKQEPDKIVYTYYSKDRFARYLDEDVPSFWIDKTMRFVYLECPADILNEICIGERVSVVFLDSVSFVPDNMIEEAKNCNLPEMFVTFSIIKNALVKELNDNYKDFDVKKNGDWTVITATRFK